MRRSILFLIFGLVSMMALTSCDGGNEVDGDAIDTSSVQVDSIDADQTATLDEINQRLRANINDPELYHERAEFLMTLVNSAGNYSPKHVELAINDLKRAISLDSAVADYHFDLAEIYYAMNAPGPAMEEYEAALKHDETLVDAYLQVGRIFFVYQEYEKALAAYDRALKEDQFLAEAYYMKGLVFKEKGDTVKAVSSYETAREVDPNYFDPSFDLGLLYAGVDDDRALQYFDAALAADPGNVEALYAKGLYAQEHDSLELAMNTYFELLGEDSNHINGNYGIGYSYLVYVQDFDSAAMFFDKVLALQPENANALYNLGYAYELKGDKASAEAQYRAALELQPDFDLPAKGLSRLGL